MIFKNLLDESSFSIGRVELNLSNAEVTRTQKNENHLNMMVFIALIGN